MKAALLLLLLILGGLAFTCKAQSVSNQQLIKNLFQPNNNVKTEKPTLYKTGNPNLRTHTINFSWNGSGWDTSGRDIYNYDNKGQVETVTFEDYKLGSFIPQRRELMQYNSTGQMIVWTYQFYNSSNSQWENNAKNSIAYDANGNETFRLLQMWKDNKWENNRRFTYGYNKYNVDTIILFEDWFGSAWHLGVGYRKFITYTSGGDMKVLIYQNYDEFTGWYNHQKLEFTLDANDKITGGTWYNYDDTTNTWTELARIVNAKFRKNNFYLPESYIMQVDFPVTGWADAERFTATYNSRDVLDSSLTEKLDPITQRWTNDIKEVYKYNSYNKQIYHNYQQWQNNSWVTQYGETDDYVYDSLSREAEHTKIFWDIANGNWKPGNKHIHFYPKTSGLGANNFFSVHKIYPNPAKEMIKVELQCVPANSARITITDLAGRTVYTENNLGAQAGTLRTDINISNLKQGIYIMQVQAGNQLINQKFIKE